jgi:hypothetical protein
MNKERMIKQAVVTFVGVIMIAAFTNCGVANMMTASMDSDPTPLASQPPKDESPKVERDLNIDIPSSPYQRLSESPYFKLTEYSEYTNFKLYSPQYPLYSDGSTKRRWFYLPPGAQIDNTQPDEWIFPAGSILFKEFSLNGKKIETRVFEKINNQTGISAWRASVYVWLTDQTDAHLLKTDNFYALTEFERQPYQANGVADKYRMANLSQCQSCHTSAKDVSQGFSYLQLSDIKNPVNVLSLSNKFFFKQPFEQLDKILGTPTERAAIGYIQSNCATCHNGKGPAPHNFKHNSYSQTLSEEPLFQSIKNAPGLVTFGDSANSRLYKRMENRSMPRITLYTPDTEGWKIINDWINTSTTPIQ